MGVVVKCCWGRWVGDAMEVKVERVGGAMARDLNGNRGRSRLLLRTAEFLDRSRAIIGVK